LTPGPDSIYVVSSEGKDPDPDPDPFDWDKPEPTEQAFGSIPKKFKQTQPEPVKRKCERGMAEVWEQAGLFD